MGSKEGWNGGIGKGRGGKEGEGDGGGVGKGRKKGGENVWERGKWAVLGLRSLRITNFPRAILWQGEEGRSVRGEPGNSKEEGM